MDRLRRNKLCIWLILIGLANFAIYTVVYFAIGGDARNGYVKVTEGRKTYHLGGWDVLGQQRESRQVSPALWIYSYAHSISIWITQAAVLVSMLLLARPHIIATMKGTIISGQTFVAASIFLVLLVAGLSVIMFCWNFARELAQ